MIEDMILYGFVKMWTGIYRKEGRYSKKKNESTKFKKNNLITKVDVHRLSGRDYRIKTSNIMTVLDSYQELKRK